jgi:hypothetical protein
MRDVAALCRRAIVRGQSAWRGSEIRSKNEGNYGDRRVDAIGTGADREHPSQRLYDRAGEMSREVHEAANSLREQLGSALKLLSTDLYSSDTHFLLELIQNADDNSYPSGVVPTARIELTLQRLVFFNNEVGFAEKNVRAV